MAKKQEIKVVTRAEKKDATKSVIKELLAVKPLKHNELIEETAKIYTQRFGGEDTENVNDVKGRVGSVVDIMKKDSEIMYDGGMYALKSRLPAPPVEEKKEDKAEEKPAKKPRAKAKKVEAEAVKEEVKEEKPKKTTKKATKKTEEPVAVKEETEKTEKPVKKAKTAKAKKEKTETAEPLPPAPLQPNAPVVPVTPEIAPEPIPDKRQETEEQPKKTVRARTKKTAAKKEEKPTEKAEEKPVEEKGEKHSVGTPMVALKEEKAPVEDKAEPQEKAEKSEIKNPPAVKEKGEVAKKTEVIDMSFLFGTTPVKSAPKKAEEKTEKAPEKPVEKAEKATPKTEKEEKVAEEKPAPAPTPAAEPVKEEKPALKVVKTDEKRVKKVVQTIRKVEKKPQTADERLKEAFLKKLRSLGGDYFEYYSVYLLERYSMKNGRRLEGLRISGGDRDGGIDGEIELTDKFGFRETIYIQSKNWNPDKGDERLWVVGETLLQQFIGACACRQAQDRKQHCRGIFITTSRFTPDAKRILDTMSDKIVGYDGEDLFEAAKECQFGLVYENGNWKLDEKLLSGTKAFFNML